MSAEASLVDAQHVLGRQARGQPAHRGAAAEHAQRVLADLPDARRAGTIGNAYGDLRYTINGARPRSSDTLIDGVTATFPTVTGGRASRSSRRLTRSRSSRCWARPSRRSSAAASAASSTSSTSRGRTNFHGSALRVPARFGARLAELLSEAARREAGRFLAAPVRRRPPAARCRSGKMFYMASFEGLREKAVRLARR